VNSGIRKIGNLQIPPLSGGGFTSGKYTEGPNYQRRVGNVPFTVVPLLAAITPINSGLLQIDELTGSVVANPRDPFDFDAFFGRRPQPQQIPLSMAKRDLKVLPLPTENVPPGFNGAVGGFTMNVSAGPTNVAVGDPITVKIQISGRGALESLSLPEQTKWRDFKTYPPTAKPAETADPLGLQGTKMFEQVVVPQNTEIKELPQFSFSFFDPEQKQYRTLTQPAVKLVVRPGGTVVAPTIAALKSAGQDNPPPAQDIVPIKQRLGTAAQIQSPLVQQPWFLALQAVPVLSWIAAFAWRKRTEMLANNPRLRRQRRVAQIIREGLVELRQQAAENKSDEFFATLVRLLQEQLGERLDLPASAITEAVIEERLRPRNVPEVTLAAFHELFQACNLARYAPVQSSQELAALIPKIEMTLRELQAMKI